MKISGRSSSITAAFVTAIIPQIEPTPEEVREALDILGMSPEKMECAYCGGLYSEWDHLRPLVVDRKPTGFISEIRNLVPSCGKCNQSKGNKNWQAWIGSNARLSPKTRGVADLTLRIARLTKYEEWGHVVPLDLSVLVTAHEWDEHWDNWKRLLRLMNDAQDHASRLRVAIRKKIG
jgi:5-methylcytosine-specific restriction endonuclease McrA